MSVNGPSDAFVAKLNPTGTALVYATYLGGNTFDVGEAIAVDPAGNAYVAGFTASPNFPTTFGAADTVLGGAADAFVAKLSPTGAALTYATLLGGSSVDSGSAIAVDGSGNAYVTGITASPAFATIGAFDTTQGGQDAFAAKINAAGSTIVYATYLGGSGLEVGTGIAVDGAGQAFVAGNTESNDFPTASAFDTTLGGTADAFVTKLNAAGTGVVYSTYFGGNDRDFGADIALDASGNAYMTGSTFSNLFPTVNAFDSTLGGSGDGFVAKLSASGVPLYSTYLGGSDSDFGQGIAVEGFRQRPCNRVHALDRLPDRGGIRHQPRPLFDAFVTRLTPGGSVSFSTYLGGGANDLGEGIAVDPSGQDYVVGDTNSTNLATPGSFDTTLAGSQDPFVAKIGFGCQGAIDNQTVQGNLVVPPGTVCSLRNTTVTGNVVIQAGGILVLRNGATVNGTVTGQGELIVIGGSTIRGNVVFAGGVFLCGSTFGGSVTIRNGPVNAQIIIGGPSCPGGGNSIAGTLMILNNQISAITISGNRIGGNLVCSGNTPAPAGGPNTVSGARTGQCAGL